MHIGCMSRGQNLDGSCTLPKYVGYIRVSTDAQGDDGYSLDAQRQRIEAWAVAHNVELESIEEDVASGRYCREKRPGLDRALSLLEKGEAQGLVFLRLDRFSRNQLFTLEQMQTFAKKHWAFVSVEDGLDSSSPMGRAMISVIAAFSQLEREVTSARTKDAMKTRRQSGLTNNTLPFGYMTEDGKSAKVAGDTRPLIENPEEMELLEKIYDLRDRHGWGAVMIANEMGTNPRTGKPFNRGSIQAFFRRRDRWGGNIRMSGTGTAENT